MTSRPRRPPLKASFVRARWWQFSDFISLSVEIARGRDPYADQFLAHPWSPSGLLERIYLLDTFFRSSAYFIEIAGRFVGVVWLIDRPGYIYIYSAGTLPAFQRSALGLQIAHFIIEYSRRRGDVWGVGRIAARNRPVQMLMAAFKGRPLGLSTTTLTLLGDPGPFTGLPFEVRPLTAAAARRAWRRWRLEEVEQAAGRDAVHIGSHLLENLPRGKYVAVLLEGQEIGVAFVRQTAGLAGAGLFSSAACWSDSETARIVDALESSLGVRLRRLTLARSHANRLAGSGALRFERHRDEERYYVVFRRD
jgi:hypothetical protein